MTTKIGSLFSGIGGLDLAVSAIHTDAELAWVCDPDATSSTVLKERFNVPNLGDITEVDWTQVEPVDILAGGFPCQDISHAGLQKGIAHGTRSGLWFNFAEAIEVLRPSLVYLENVAAIVYKNGPIDVVEGSLAAIGYDTEWGLLRASSVGACHQRRRWFAVCWPSGQTPPNGHATGRREHGGPEPVHQELASSELTGDGGRGPGPGQDRQIRPSAQPVTVKDMDDRSNLLPTPVVNDMSRGKTVEWWDDWTATMKAKHGNGHGNGNGNGHGKSLAIELKKVDGNANPSSKDNPAATTPSPMPAWLDSWGQYKPAIARHAMIYGPPPEPTVPSDTTTSTHGRALNPEFVTWMMCLPAGWVDIDGLSRSKQIQRLGNAVVPAQAYHAYQQLLTRSRQEI